MEQGDGISDSHIWEVTYNFLLPKAVQGGFGGMQHDEVVTDISYTFWFSKLLEFK